MIKITNINKAYQEKHRPSQVIFNQLNFNMNPTETSIAITGRSGSGKSTLLNIIAGLDISYEGSYHFQKKFCRKNSQFMADLRLKNFGLITQNYNLLTDRTIFENVAISLKSAGLNKNELKQKVEMALEQVGLADYQSKLPQHLSGGESQRVAIARALVKEPKLLLADEPTGALDESTEEEILTIFSDLISLGHKMIIVTHSQAISNFCENHYEMKNKKIVVSQTTS